jgi:hypothetical protein
MRGMTRHVISAAVAIGLAIAIAPPLLAQGYTLNGARLGTARDITMTIPAAGGNAQKAFVLRLDYSGGRGASCSTGSLADWWGSNGTQNQNPGGVTPGYSDSPMRLPSNATRTVVLNVASTAKPGTWTWTIRVPSGECSGSNQTATISLTLKKAPPAPQPAAGDVRRSQKP